MEKWDYAVVKVQGTSAQQLDNLGENGWELAGIVQGVLKPGANPVWLVEPTYVFKKRKT